MRKSTVLLLTILSPVMMPFLRPAHAGIESWVSSGGGKTVFNSPASSACNAQPVPYVTEYQGVSFKGTIFVHPEKVQCADNQIIVEKDYFEEISQDGKYHCQGSLTLNLVKGNPGSYVEWHTIKAVTGKRCLGTGVSVRLPLKYLGV
jgi:hypothetical protein